MKSISELHLYFQLVRGPLEVLDWCTCRWHHGWWHLGGSCHTTLSHLWKVGESDGFCTCKVSFKVSWGLKIMCQKRTTNSVLSTAVAADCSSADKLDLAIRGKLKLRHSSTWFGDPTPSNTLLLVTGITKPPWLDWSCCTPRAASNMQVKRKPSKRPSGGKRKSTSELSLANRKSLFTSIKGLGRPVLISPSRSEVEACKCGDICTAGHCKLPSNCRSMVCSFSLISWWGWRSGFQLEVEKLCWGTLCGWCAKFHLHHRSSWRRSSQKVHPFAKCEK